MSSKLITRHLFHNQRKCQNVSYRKKCLSKYPGQSGQWRDEIVCTSGERRGRGTSASPRAMTSPHPSSRQPLVTVIVRHHHSSAQHIAKVPAYWGANRNVQASDTEDYRSALAAAAVARHVLRLHHQEQ
jgi:hypothetical protein